MVAGGAESNAWRRAPILPATGAKIPRARRRGGLAALAHDVRHHILISFVGKKKTELRSKFRRFRDPRQSLVNVCFKFSYNTARNTGSPSPIWNPIQRGARIQKRKLPRYISAICGLFGTSSAVGKISSDDKKLYTLRFAKDTSKTSGTGRLAILVSGAQLLA